MASSGSPTALASPSADFTLSNIIRVLQPLEDKYDILGTHLGVKLEDLKQIEGDYPRNARRFTETIGFWQNNNPNPSWSTLANAVERVGGHDGLLKKVRACAGSSNFTGNHDDAESSEDPGYSSKIGDSPSRDSSGSGYSSKISDSPFRDSSGSGYSSKISDSPFRESSGSEAEYFDKVPGCGCDKPCSIYTIIAGRCPRPTNTKVGMVRKRVQNPWQTTRDALPEEKGEEEDYTEEFEKQTKQLRIQFAGLVSDICASFDKRNVTTDRAVLFLQNAHPLALKPRTNEMTKATNLDQVLTIVTAQACSWFDYEVIKDLICKLGDDHDKKLLHDYEATFKKYIEQRRPKGKKHIEVGGGVRKGGKQLVVKIDKEWDEINFSDLDKIRGNLAAILGARRRDL